MSTDTSNTARESAAKARGLRIPRVNMPALVVTLIVAVVGPLFVASYSLAMADPEPRGVPIGIVGDGVHTSSIQSAINTAHGDDLFTVREFSSLDAARDALSDQSIYGVFDTSATPFHLYLSSASGSSVARVLEAQVPLLKADLHTTIDVTDVHPLAPHDPGGLVLFYLALGATILGFVGAIQTRVNASGMTLRAEVSWDAIRSLVVAFLMTIVIGPVLGFEAFPILPVWLVLAVTMFIASMVYSFWRALIGGKWALLPTWLMFVIVANPSSGGAVAPELLPPFYEFMGRWLPSGATVRALRDLTYFPGHVNLEPYVVLGIWLIVSAAAFIFVRARRFGTGVISAKSGAAPVPVAASETFEKEN